MASQKGLKASQKKYFIGKYAKNKNTLSLMDQKLQKQEKEIEIFCNKHKEKGEESFKIWQEQMEINFNLQIQEAKLVLKRQKSELTRLLEKEEQLNKILDIQKRRLDDILH